MLVNALQKRIVMRIKNMLSCAFGTLLLGAVPAVAQKVVATVPITGFAPSALAVNTVTNKV